VAATGAVSTFDVSMAWRCLVLAYEVTVCLGGIEPRFDSGFNEIRAKGVASASTATQFHGPGLPHVGGSSINVNAPHLLECNLTRRYPPQTPL
jgi:hypothetical protein